ncbi:MAG: flagellar biosynthesis protein FlhF [Gammaproteobacteria bacterium]|nr:flagellar biosynthesis protein FlhF [Gammaproteobacteria bacterium]NND60329.1 flagellar biosynthesis protein FlhF [Gammaproteobacteria bacterium]
MKIKRFVAPDMRRAMRMVREEQGPDAVILSNRRVDGGIEVVTAIDYDESLLSPVSKPEPKPAAAVSQVTPIDPPVVDWSREPTLLGMKQEVASLRKLLESQLASLAWNDTVRRHPVRAGVLRRLSSLGLPQELACMVAEQADGADIDSAFEYALRFLDASLPTHDREIIDETGAVALVGPTGVGKTTTIAKLAARFVLKHGADALGLVTTDGFRIGAHEQLVTFGRILGVPVQLVRDADELHNALEALRDKRLVLIDSAGISQRDKRIEQELAALREARDDIRVLLTLSSHAQPGVLDEAIGAFADLDPCGCILTKLDEAASLGGAIAALVRHGLPLAYATDGQNVPEDLHWARSKRLDLVTRAAALADSEPDAVPAAAMTDFSEVPAHA